MRFAAMVPDPATGRLKPFCGVSGIAITFNAADQDEANRLAKVNRLPHAVLVLPDELTEVKFELGDSDRGRPVGSFAESAAQRQNLRKGLSMSRRAT